MRPRIAAVIATHNRRDLTARCIERLRIAARASDVDVSLVVVDDKSTDGTSEYLHSALVPGRDVLIPGTGALYWGGATRLGMISALRSNTRFTHLLLLNDDTVLFDDALQRILGCENSGRVVVGTVQDPESKIPTYGLLRRASIKKPFAFSLVSPNGDAPISGDTMNGNVALVPRSICDVVGVVDSAFRHGMGDIDFGLRVRRNGYEIVTPEVPIGECRRNPGEGTWVDRTLSRRTRVRLMLGPKGLPPRDWARFCLRHGGMAAPLYIVWPWFRIALGR